MLATWLTGTPCSAIDADCAVTGNTQTRLNRNLLAASLTRGIYRRGVLLVCTNTMRLLPARTYCICDTRPYTRRRRQLQGYYRPLRPSPGCCFRRLHRCCRRNYRRDHRLPSTATATAAPLVPLTFSLGIFDGEHSAEALLALTLSSADPLPVAPRRFVPVAVIPGNLPNPLSALDLPGHDPGRYVERV